MKMDFKEGVKIQEGVKIEEGIDFAKLHAITAKSSPKASSWAKSYLYGKRSAPQPKQSRPRMDFEKKGSDKWTVVAILPEAPSGEGVTKLEKGSRSELYNRKMDLFRAGSYARGCVVRIGYTNPGQKFSNRGRLHKFLEGKDIGTGAYNRGLIGYISRAEATLEEKPDWEQAKQKFPVYTYDKEVGELKNMTTDQALAFLQDEPVFKVVLSPEDKGVDISQFTALFMDRLSEKFGYSLKWCAANHYNTDHPHTHIVFSRQTKDGKLLRLNDKYIKRQFRKEAQDILTQIQGPVRWEEELEKINKESKSMGFCDIDRKILALAKTNPSDPTRVPVHRIANSNAKTYIQVSKRLQELNRRHLVEFEKQDKNDPLKREGAWVIKKNFEKEVRKDEFARELEMDVSGFVLDRGHKNYKCSVIKAKRINEDEPRVLMALVDENGVKHLREENIDEDMGTEMPQGVFDVLNLKSLLAKGRELDD